MAATTSASVTPDAPRTDAAPADRWLLVAGTGLAVFMAQLDTSIVAVTIQADLGGPTSTAQWVVLGCLVPVVALTLSAGRWLDQVGQRAALVGSVAGFGLASVAAGAAPTMSTLIGARVAQGAFAATLFALLPAVTTTAVRPEVRGREMGVVTTVGPLGAVVGPAAGGLLLERLDWGWIFFVNVPVALVVIAIARSQLPAGTRLGAPERSLATQTLLFGAAAVSTLLALSLTAERGPGWLVLALLAVPALAAWWRTSASRPVRDLLATPGMAAPHLALAAEMGAVMVVVFLAPYYLLREVGASVSTTGLTLLAFPAAMTLLGPVGGILADRWGERRTALTGVVVLTAGMALVAPLADTWTPTDLAWRLAVAGIGAGLFAAPDVSMAMALTPARLLNTTGATTSLARQLGIALGPALATTVWATAGYTLAGMQVAVGVATGLGALGVVALWASPPSATTPPATTRSGRQDRTEPSDPTRRSS